MRSTSTMRPIIPIRPQGSEPTTDFQCKAVTRGSADLCQLAAEVVRQADF